MQSMLLLTSNGISTISDSVSGTGGILGALGIIIVTIDWCMLFHRDGEAWWKVFIPIYDDYIKFKLYWTTKNFWLFVLAIIIAFFSIAACVVAAGLDNYKMLLISALIAMASLFYVLVVSILLDIKLAERYGKGKLFAIGLVFLNVIFLTILAFGPRIDKALDDMDQL